MEKNYKKRLIALVMGATLLTGLAIGYNQIGKVDAANNNDNLFKMENGKLSYVKYANTGESDKINTIPNFSYCGYKNGGVALPEVSVVKTISPKSGDCTQLIQNAIDEVSKMPLKNGHRGAILLKKGTYNVSKPLYIKKDGIVIRGEGQDTAKNGGTQINATASKQQDLFVIQGNLKRSYGSHYSITNKVGTGSNTLQLKSTKNLKKGDKIVVVFTPNDKWIDDLGTRSYGWTASQYVLRYERNITGISGNTITIDIPMVQTIQSKYGGGYVALYSESGRVNECGIENMYVQSHYDNDDDESHGWNAINFNSSNNCWVKSVTAKYFGYSCVVLNEANRTTVQDCAMLEPKSKTTGGRKYSFSIGKGSFNLFQRCYATGGRHDYVTGSKVTGPNAFVDCVAEKSTADTGPHHRYATGLLFDSIECGQIRVRDRGTSGSGHGWSGAQTMFWNVNANNNEIQVDSPKGALNWGIGCKSKVKLGSGYYLSYGKNVAPRSLYIQQLKDRLGEKALNNVITNEQNKGTIISQIKKWKGVGALNVTKSSTTSNTSNNNASNKNTSTSNNTSSSSTTISYPGNFKIVATDDSKVRITWNKVSNISGYEVARSTEKNGEYKIINDITDINRVQYTNSGGIKSGKTYFYKMRTYKKVNCKKVYSKWTCTKSVEVK